MKKVFWSTLVAAIASVMFTVTAIAVPAISVYIENQRVEFDVPPVIENGRIMVPARAIFEALGAEVGWDKKSQTVNVITGDLNINLIVNESFAEINRTYREELARPVSIINGRVMVPLSFAGEVFGTLLSWDAKTSTVLISFRPMLRIQELKLETLAELGDDVTRIDFRFITEDKILIEATKTDTSDNRNNQVMFGNLNVNTNTVTEFIYFNDNRHPVLLPDGRVLVRDDRDIDGLTTNSKFYIYEPNNRKMTKLCTVQRHKYGIYFSEQGEILFDSFNPEKNQSDFYKINLQGQVIRITNTPDIIEAWPEWAPDGKQIAFISYPKYYNKTPYISVLNTDGKGEAKFKFPADGVSDLYWSPDSSYLVYQIPYTERSQKDVALNDNFGIWVIKADGTEGKRLFNTKESFDLMTWAANGQRLIAENDSGFIVINRDGTGPKRFKGHALCISPDGRWLLSNRWGVTWLYDLAGDQVGPVLKGPIEKIIWGSNPDEIYIASRNKILKLTILK